VLRITVLIGDTKISKKYCKLKRNFLKIPAGERLTSWPFTKRRGVEFGTTKHKSIQWQRGGFQPVTSGLQILRPNQAISLPS
jgi:hypothetical protein